MFCHRRERLCFFRGLVVRGRIPLSRKGGGGERGKVASAYTVRCCAYEWRVEGGSVVGWENA